MSSAIRARKSFSFQAMRTTGAAPAARSTDRHEADLRRVEFVDQPQPVAFVSGHIAAERHQGEDLVGLLGVVTVLVDGHLGRERLALAFELLHAPHRNGRRRPVDNDGKPHCLLRGKGP